MIKYLGSKRVLVPLIVRTIGRIEPARTVADLFSGTSRVGHALKRAGYRVLANDHNAYAEALARCYVAADRDAVGSDAARLIAELNRLPGRPGWFTATYCERARFFTPRNGVRIDAIREAIARRDLPPELEAVLLVSLMEAADRVDSTTGVQMAYLKRWASRASNPLELRLPDLLPRALHGKGRALGLDALEAARRLEADVVYLDPPYNQHSYRGNYHIWETLVRWDHPEVYGTACKRIDCRSEKSRFNSRRAFMAPWSTSTAFLPSAAASEASVRRSRRRLLAQCAPPSRVWASSQRGDLRRIPSNAAIAWSYWPRPSEIWPRFSLASSPSSRSGHVSAV